jgi:hypothetical protein
MQEKLESRWFGRLLISAFVVVTVGAMVVWNLPGSKLRAEGMRLAAPYVRAVGLDQNWSVFAPNPYRETFELYARVSYADGTTRTWPVPEGSDAIGTYWDFRWGKWAEWVIAGSHPDLCRGTATYVANREADEGRDPVQIDLVRRRRANFRPGQEPSYGSWEEADVCTSEVVEAQDAP